MRNFRKLPIFALFLAQLLSCSGQNVDHKNVLSDNFDEKPPFYYKMPDILTATDTSPSWSNEGTQILLTGTIYQLDGQTPAANTILYYYQTNSKGHYVSVETEERNMPPNVLGQTHGYIRGWIKTDESGKYAIYTTVPGTYPSRQEPAHIHVSIKEPQLSDHYYIDDFVFDHDPLLNSEKRNEMENRAGSGVIRFVEKNGLLIGERDLIQGLNIPNYSANNFNANNSGRKKGENVISFTPFHAYGPDKGTKTCPICKYGWYHGILYFVGRNPNWLAIKKWLVFFENESEKRTDYLKVFLVYGNNNFYNKNERIIELERIGKELELRRLALTFVPSFSDSASSIVHNKINPEVENTIIIYKRSIIIDKYIDLTPEAENFKLISNILDESINPYFKLPRAKTK